MPSVLFIEEGEYGADGENVRVKISLSIYGAGREKTTLVGVGLYIGDQLQPDLNWNDDGIVEIGDLTIQGGKGDGLSAACGMNVTLRRISIVDCQGCGLMAVSGGYISCDDLQVIGCGKSGVVANYKAIITLSGEGTSIQGNGLLRPEDVEPHFNYRYRIGYRIYYGLHANGSSSKLQLVVPLTKEQVSTNNGGGGNWGGDKGSTIDQVDNDGVVVQVLYEGEDDFSGLFL